MDMNLETLGVWEGLPLERDCLHLGDGEGQGSLHSMGSQGVVYNLGNEQQQQKDHQSYISLSGILNVLRIFF